MPFVKNTLAPPKTAGLLRLAQITYAQFLEASINQEWHGLGGGMCSMDTDLPLIDNDRITRAAEGMISNYGKDALAEAVRRAQTMRSAGCDPTAVAWERICEVIEGRLGGLALVEPASTLPQFDRPQQAKEPFKASFFETL